MGQALIDPATRPPLDPPSWWNRFTVGAFRALGAPAIRALFRVRVENPPRLDGPYVLAANHTSFLDPLLVGAACPRRITFLMTSVIYRGRALGWFCRWNRAIPLLQRGGNREALRAARHALQRGEVVGIFPEGALARDGRLMLGNPGAVALVYGEDVPVVPVGITGAYETMPPGRGRPRRVPVTIRFGAPLTHAQLSPPDVGRKDRLVVATTTLMRAIAELSGQRAREDELRAQRG
ncbi:MAG: 1-acyl-sn-glycerol-3-phosphate acyltransferase [Planctomycetes bacterium]|nr:1-acyl-sn-glycerol-3-phosphate acyltransferase [Planctomycetota bacterium]